MTLVQWFYTSADPLASGELRRLGLCALALEDSRWSCTFTHIGQASAAVKAEIHIVPIEGLEAFVAAELAGKVVVEVTQNSMTSSAQLLLANLADRIDLVVARSRRSAELARAAIGSRAAVSLIADPAERVSELTAAAARFRTLQEKAKPAVLPDGCELWFAEPGDAIEPDEITALHRRWSQKSDRPRVAIAPPAELLWLEQAGIKASSAPWSPETLGAALRTADHCILPFTDTFSFARRRRKAHRSSALTQGSQDDALEDDFDPLVVANAWRGVLNDVLIEHEARDAGAPSFVILLLLDLIQDLDLALPLIDELRSRATVQLRVVVSSWLALHSPRVTTQLNALNLVPELIDRTTLEQEHKPQLDNVRAVLTIAESSLPPHRRAHMLFRRAKALGIPTFSFQHGVENIGLNYFEQTSGQSSEIASDHLFVWFGPAAAPVAAPAALKPKLLHVGRPRRPQTARHLSGVLLGFERIGGVFENLHWSRFDQAYRRRFVEDLIALANARSETAILLKPHHAGLWSTRNRQFFTDWPANLILADPTDPFWEPFTAPALIDIADFVVTTPSTVALDAASAAKPVAVVAYDLDLPIYAPLPLIRTAEDWLTFADDAGSARDAQCRAAFLDTTVRGDNAARTAVDHIIAVARRRARFVPHPPAVRHG